MKNIKFIIAASFATLLLSLGGCKKESVYKEYVNTVQTFNGSALAYLQAQPKGTFDSLLLVLNRYPFLKDSLTNEKVTLFAPVNESFEASLRYLNIQRKAKGRTAVNLSNADEIQLAFMLCKYIIRGNRTSEIYAKNTEGFSLKAIVSDYPMFVTYKQLSSSGYVAGGPASLDYSDTYGSNFKAVWTTTTTKAININTTNATINILSPLHGFGFDEFTDRLDN